MHLYLSFKNYLKARFKQTVWRVPLSLGLPCPNRSNGKNGCTFCNGQSFIAHYMQKGLTLDEQLNEGMKFFGQRYHVDYFLAYFQDNTSTYGPLQFLLENFERALSHDRVLGIIISTRPDYINRDLVMRLEQLRQKFKDKDFWLELGLQSVSDQTLERIERNHTYADFQKAVRLIGENSSIKIGVHMILGLPGESLEQMQAGIIRLFRENQLNGLKLRILDILPDTKLHEEYQNRAHDFYHFTNQDYVDLLCNIYERIPGHIVILRSLNYNPVHILNQDKKRWTKDQILLNIKKEMTLRQTRQGIYFSPG